jgi:hypothetical protein
MPPVDAVEILYVVAPDRNLLAIGVFRGRNPNRRTP